MASKEMAVYLKNVGHSDLILDVHILGTYVHSLTKYEAK